MDINRSKLAIVSLLMITICPLILTLSIHAASRGIRVKAKTSSGMTKEIRLYSDYYALVVGCGDYQSGWPMLPNPVKDAREVAATLKNMGWKVDVLENPEGRLFRRKLNQLIVGPGRDRNKGILLWFSGHGYTLKEADGLSLGYLVPIDAPDPDKDEIGFMEKAISMRYIETVAKRIKSKHVLMAFDSCFSGAIFQMVRAKPSPYIQEKVSEPVRQFITAGNESEQVPDRSVFKDVFIQGIHKGYADRNNDRYVTGEELGSYLQEKVVNYSRKSQHPQFGKINNPWLDKGDFVFSVVTSDAVVDSTKPSPSNAYLSVESNVPGARVLVDGHQVGTTDLSDVDIASGDHLIRVEKSGYEPYVRKISFERGRSRNLYVVLDPKSKRPEDSTKYLPKSSIVSQPEFAARDGNYIAYTNGVVFDSSTRLEWFVGPDRSTNWHEAKSWAESLAVDGGGWRMPTKNELKTLYQRGVGTRNMTPLLKTTGWWVWSGESKDSSSVWYFYFVDGVENWSYRVSPVDYTRGFAVRSRK